MNQNTKEVVIEFVENTTTTVRKKVRFDENVDFENPSEDLQELLVDKFLKCRPDSVEQTMTILHDEDVEDYRYRDVNYSDGVKKVPVYDEFVYMDKGLNPHSRECGTPKHKLARFEHLSQYNVQSVLYFGKVGDCIYPSYFQSYDYDGFIMFFSEKKEDLVSLWENKKIKSLLDSQVWINQTRYQLTKVFDFFEKGIPTKSMKEDSYIEGYETWIAVLGDIDDYRKFNFTPRNTILLGERDYASEEVA